MEAIVDIALPTAPAVILLQDREERLIAPLLRRERQDRGVSPGECGARTRQPAITRRRVVLRQVDVGVDAAGRDIRTFGVDYLGVWTGRRKIGRDAEDLAIFDSNALAGREDLGGRDLLQCVRFQCARDFSLADQTHDCRVFDDEV